eukprot:368819_1
MANEELKVLVDLCTVPLHTGRNSVAKEVAIIQQILEKSGLKYKMHSFGTSIEGKWNDVLKVIKQCHEELHYKHNVPRLFSSIKLSTRIDKQTTLQSKIDRVHQEMSKL